MITLEVRNFRGALVAQVLIVIVDSADFNPGGRSAKVQASDQIWNKVDSSALNQCLGLEYAHVRFQRLSQTQQCSIKFKL